MLYRLAMRKTVPALLLFALSSLAIHAQEPAPKPITIALETLGDTEQGVAARVSFRFAQPAEVPPETGLFLQGSLLQGGQVVRNFRFPVAPNSNSVSTVQMFAEGEVEVEVRLVMPIEEGAPVIVAKVNEKFTVAKTNQPYIAGNEDGADALLAEGVLPETVGAVKIRAPRRDVAPNLFILGVDVLPPV